MDSKIRLLRAVNRDSLQNYNPERLRMKLRKSERRNYRLEQLLEQRTRKLAEVVDSKVKSIRVIAHDLRAPFTSILGFLELIKMKIHNKSRNDLESYVEMATDSTIRALSLLDNMLSWAISQNIDKYLNKTTFNLTELVEEELRTVSSTAHQKQIFLNHSSPHHIHVTADIYMIRSTIRNLINNAIKFTGRGGRVDVILVEEAEIIHISVSDTGVGMTDQELAQLFNAEGPHTTFGTNQEPGSGMGLLICKDFIEMHGGNLEILSEAGKGSTFSFTLPKIL